MLHQLPIAYKIRGSHSWDYEHYFTEYLTDTASHPKREECSNLINLVKYTQNVGACGGAVVETLHYKPEGRGIDSRWCHWNFSFP
jgi:hypothetical protein